MAQVLSMRSLVGVGPALTAVVEGAYAEGEEGANRAPLVAV